MDYESERSRALGCWAALDSLRAQIEAWSSRDPVPDFVPGDTFVDFVVDVGLGKECPAETREFWKKEVAKNYLGEEGRKRIIMASINLRDRDGLHSRLADVSCPVLWLHVSFAGFICRKLYLRRHGGLETDLSRELKMLYIALRTQRRRLPCLRSRPMLAWRSSRADNIF
jgi:hypothetical protein